MTEDSEGNLENPEEEVFGEWPQSVEEVEMSSHMAPSENILNWFRIKARQFVKSIQ